MTFRKNLENVSTFLKVDLKFFRRNEKSVFLFQTKNTLSPRRFQPSEMTQSIGELVFVLDRQGDQSRELSKISNDQGWKLETIRFSPDYFRVTIRRKLDFEVWLISG